MSTLIEIKAAVDRLPYPEQEILLEHLIRKLGVCRSGMEVHECNANVGGTPASPVASQPRNRSLQQILDDIKAEGC